MGSIKGHPWIERLLNYYLNRKFIKNDGTLDTVTNTQTITDITKNEYGLITRNNKQVLNGDIVFYPSEYFCPKDWRTRELNITKNTYTIHHFSGSWLPKISKYKKLKLLIHKNLVSTLIFLFGIRNYLKLRKLIFGT